MIFDSTEELKEYLAVEYHNSRGKELAFFDISPMLSLVAVYEGEDLVQGLMLYRDPSRDFKWVLLDSLHADLATRYYIEYIGEMTEAISLFELLEHYEEVEEKEEKEFGLDLD